MFVTTSGDRKAKIYTWDGILKWETIRGDVYMSDVLNTKGHIGEITSVNWLSSKTDFFSTSRDGSVWIWNIESKVVGVEQQLMHQWLIKAHHFKTNQVVPITESCLLG